MPPPSFIIPCSASPWVRNSGGQICTHSRILSVPPLHRIRLKVDERSDLKPGLRRNPVLSKAQPDEIERETVSKSPEHPSSVKAEKKDETLPVPTGKIYAPRQMRGGGRRRIGNIRTQGVKYVRLPPNPPGIRVSAGSVRGRVLKTPNVYLRPMMGKVREALFSMLRVFGALNNQGSVLDLYCGSGSVGIEALSRGMGRATFVDYAQECIDTTTANLKACQFEGSSEAVCMSVEDFLSSWKERKRLQAEKEMNSVDKNVIKRDYFDIITITPPYEEVDYSILMQQVVDSGCVGAGTFVVVEYPVEIKTMPPTIAHRLIGIRNRKYGRTMLAVYACQPPVDLEARPDEFSIGKR